MLRGDHRAEHRVRLVRVADLEDGRHLRQAFDHLLVDRALHDRTGRRGADLARMERPHRADHLDGGLDVGVVEHQARALAAELEQQALHRAAADLGDALPDAGGTGERDHVDVAGLDERLTGVRRRTGDDVDHAGREPDLVQDADEVDHRERVLRRGAHHDGVAHRERGPELAGHVDDREVVRRDARDRARRLATRDRAHEPAGRERGGRHLLGRQRDDANPGRAVSSARRAYVSKRVHAVGTCICLPTVSVQPVSAITSGNRSAYAP